jgi:hypothetical protein
MAKANSTQKIAPSVRIVPRPSGVFQIRYHDPASGNEVRISSKTKDRKQAEDKRDEIKAKLLLGIDPRENADDKQGRLSWDVFRDRYYALHLKKKKDPKAVEYRLDIIERVAKPRFVDDLMDVAKVKGGCRFAS